MDFWRQRRRKPSPCDLFALGAPRALPSQFDAVGVLDEPIEDRVGVGRISDDFKPVVHWKLQHHDVGFASTTLFLDFQEIVSRGGAERLHASGINRSMRSRGRKKRAC